MSKAPQTPEQLKRLADVRTAAILFTIQTFIERQKVSKSLLADTIGVKQQQMARFLGAGGSKPRIDTLLLIQAGLEQITGITLRVPQFTSPAPPPAATKTIL